MEGSNSSPTLIREAKPDDHNFIYSTWLKSYRQSDWAKSLSNDTFFFHHKQIIADILSNPLTEISIICNADDPDHIIGYIVAEKVKSSALIHFCYIKYNYRKLGIVKGAFSQLGYLSNKITFITHLPRHFQKLKGKYNLEFNPYLLKEIE